MNNLKARLILNGVSAFKSVLLGKFFKDEYVVKAFSRKDFDFLPEKISSFILQQTFCLGLLGATLQKRAKIQIPMDISSLGEKVCYWIEDEVFLKAQSFFDNKMPK